MSLGSREREPLLAKSFGKGENIKDVASRKQLESSAFTEIETENAVHALKDAFLGDLFWRYMLGTDGTQKFLEPITWVEKVKNRIGFWYWINRKIVLHASQGNSFIVAYRAKNDSLSSPQSLYEYLVEYTFGFLGFLGVALSSGIGRRRSSEFKAANEAAEKQCLGERKNEMLYVHLLATSPKVQGQGYGGRLLDAIGDLADSQGRATWLISAGPHNVPFYERHGYKTIKDIIVGESDIDWKGGQIILPLMVREPRYVAVSGD